MQDLEDYDERLSKKIEELQDGLNEVGGLSGERKREVIIQFLYF
jgi:hypothetical protein